MACLRETINIVAFNIFQSGLESDWSVIQIEVEPNHFYFDQNEDNDPFTSKLPSKKHVVSIQFHRTAVVLPCQPDQEVPAATGEMGHGMSADQDPWSSAREHEFRDIEDDMMV